MSSQQTLFLERTHSQTIAVHRKTGPGSYVLVEVFHPNDTDGIRAFMASHGEKVDPVDLQNVTRRPA